MTRQNLACHLNIQDDTPKPGVSSHNVEDDTPQLDEPLALAQLLHTMCQPCELRRRDERRRRCWCPLLPLARSISAFFGAAVCRHREALPRLQVRRDNCAFVKTTPRARSPRGRRKSIRPPSRFTDSQKSYIRDVTPPFRVTPVTCHTLEMSRHYSE